MSEEYVSVLDRLPCKFGRNDEELNIEIAEEICAEENAEKKSVALLVFRFCFLTSSEILSGSMEPTLMTGDYAIFQEFSLRKTYSLLCRILVVAF